MRKKKLSPKEVQNKIEKLKRVANEKFHKAGALRKKSFICALHCGEALLEIKDLIRRAYGHGHWKDWVSDDKNFDGSYETAVVYMRIAKNWGDPRIIKAREKITIDSIKGFQDVLKGKPYVVAGAKRDKPVNNVIYERYRKYIIAEFTREVNSLDRFKHWSHRYKLFLLGDNFYYFWTRLYVELKEMAEKAERIAERKIEKTKVNDKKEKQKIRYKAIDKVIKKKTKQHT